MEQLFGFYMYSTKNSHMKILLSFSVLSSRKFNQVLLLLASSFLWRNIIKHYWTLVSLELECTVFGLEGIQCGGVCILKTSLHCRVYFFLGFCYTKALNIEFDLDYRKHDQKGIKLRKKIEYRNNINTSKRSEMCSNVNNFNKHH